MRTSKSLPLTLALLAIAMLVFAAPAGAAGGPKGNVTGSIALSSAASVETASAGADVAYGGYASFDTTVDGRLAKNSSVYITVVCLQNGLAVYQYSGAPDFNFPLEDQPGLEWSGEAASCLAGLIYRMEKGKNVSITKLAETSFNVG